MRSASFKDDSEECRRGSSYVIMALQNRIIWLHISVFPIEILVRKDLSSNDFRQYSVVFNKLFFRIATLRAQILSFILLIPVLLQFDFLLFTYRNDTLIIIFKKYSTSAHCKVVLTSLRKWLAYYYDYENLLICFVRIYKRFIWEGVSLIRRNCIDFQISVSVSNGYWNKSNKDRGLGNSQIMG